MGLEHDCWRLSSIASDLRPSGVPVPWCFSPIMYHSHGNTMGMVHTGAEVGPLSRGMGHNGTRWDWGVHTATGRIHTGLPSTKVRVRFVALHSPLFPNLSNGKTRRSLLIPHTTNTQPSNTIEIHTPVGSWPRPYLRHVTRRSDTLMAA